MLNNLSLLTILKSQPLVISFKHLYMMFLELIILSQSFPVIYLHHFNNHYIFAIQYFFQTGRCSRYSLALCSKNKSRGLKIGFSIPIIRLFSHLLILFCLQRLFLCQLMELQHQDIIQQKMQQHKLLMIQITKHFHRFCTATKTFQPSHPFFPSEKHFQDHKFKNATAIGSDTSKALSKLCEVFAQNNVNISYLRAHSIAHKKTEEKCRLEISYRKDCQNYHSNFQNAKADLEKRGISIKESPPIRVPWFPQNMKDMDQIGRSLQRVEQNLDHSQFKDQEYRQRRNLIAKAALEYRYGDKMPEIKYCSKEIDLWCKVYKRLTDLHQKVMSRKYLQQAEELNKELGIDRRIPQLSELSEYLQSRTGFRIKPTHGVLSQREFLNALAFKHFCSTQYLRNVKNPEHSPEPDIIHEVIGHVPMFADPDVAEISHKLGLLSLGASDQEVARLGTLYWWTLEFGVCREEEKQVGYGAGIASSISEIENMLNPQTKFKKLQAFEDCSATYTDQTVQSMYRVTESFGNFIEELQAYGQSIMKPIVTAYNEQTEEIEYDRSIERVYTEDD